MSVSDPLRLAVFDLDGTLVDSLSSIVEAMRRASIIHDLAPPPAHEVRRMIGLPLGEVISRHFPDLSDHLKDAVTASYRDVFVGMREAGEVHEPLFPGTREALAALSDDSWLLGIATGKGHRGVVKSLTPHGLFDTFITVQSADTAPGKPSPEMLYQAMDETGADPAFTVMVGDTTYDMEMARNAGTKAIGVAWGYHETEELILAGAHKVAQRFKDIPAAMAELI